MTHQRHYAIAGVPIRLESDLPILEHTFQEKFRGFEIDAPDAPAIVIRHRFDRPTPFGDPPAEPVYAQRPWKIYRWQGKWIYRWSTMAQQHLEHWRDVICNEDHSRVEIFNGPFFKKEYLRGERYSLTMMPTDQIILTRALLPFQASILHSTGLDIKGAGYLFVGHSDAGKTTLSQLLRPHGQLLCDDRNIIRKENGRFQLYGTWSHGDLAEVAPGPAPLKAICFLEQAEVNRLVPVDGHKEAFGRLAGCLIRSSTTADWLQASLDLLDEAAQTVACYRLQFDKSGDVSKLFL